MASEAAVNEWYGLNDQLLAIGRKVIDYMSAPDKMKLPPNVIQVGFARKAVKTLEGIQLLAKIDA